FAGISSLQSGHRPPSMDLMSSGLMLSMAFATGSGILRIIAGMSFIMSGSFGMALIAGTAGTGDSLAGSSALSGAAANAQRDTTARRVAKRFMIISLEDYPSPLWRFAWEPAVTPVTKFLFLARSAGEPARRRANASRGNCRG